MLTNQIRVWMYIEVLPYAGYRCTQNHLHTSFDWSPIKNANSKQVLGAREIPWVADAKKSILLAPLDSLEAFYAKLRLSYDDVRGDSLFKSTYLAVGTLTTYIRLLLSHGS